MPRVCCDVFFFLDNFIVFLGLEFSFTVASSTAEPRREELPGGGGMWGGGRASLGVWSQSIVTFFHVRYGLFGTGRFLFWDRSWGRRLLAKTPREPRAFPTCLRLLTWTWRPVSWRPPAATVSVSTQWTSSALWILARHTLQRCSPSPPPSEVVFLLCAVVWT